MKWEGNRQSDNVEDRRGDGAPMLGGRSIGIGTIVVALIGGWVLGINPLTLLGMLSGGGSVVQAPAPAQAPPAHDTMAQFVSTVLADTEDVWGPIFQQGGGAYREPRLVLFRGAVPTACGTGQAAMGPFYCPGDQKVYIDLSFYDQLKNQLGAPGDFAQAYVIAHEVGHHVQYVTGIEGKVSAMRNRVSEAQANALSVRMELQADCYAGVWAARANQKYQILEDGDIQEGMNAAHKIGDDYLQKSSQGYVVPDSFTHGSSEQRMRWFKQGLQSADPNSCNTFTNQAV